VDPLAPSGPTRVADELGVSGFKVPKLYGSLGGGSSAVALIKGPVENLDCSDSNGSLSDFGNEDEGVSDLGLREDPRSLLFYLRARREKVVRGRCHSMPGLPLCMGLGCMTS